MRILYGVVGEGMGHATRSRVVLAHLVAAGHDVEVMTSGRAKDFLAKHFPGVNRIHGFHFVTRDNQVRMGQTLLSNAVAGTVGLPKNIEAYFDLVDRFAPEVVISDFESWTYFYAKAHRLPILSIDNMQIINRCRHPPEVTEGHKPAFELARAFVKGKLPFCDHYLITSFFRPPIRKERTSIYPPILRPEILAAQAERGDHLLVYQTAEGNRNLERALQNCGVPCRVYGMRRAITEDEVEGNLTYRPFSEASFIDDLRTARAAIAGGGFTVMSECVYLRKPMIAVPLRAQFEQVLNARWLERLGYGIGVQSLDDAEIVRSFLQRLDQFEGHLEGYRQDGNVALLAGLEEHLDRAAAGLY